MLRDIIMKKDQEEEKNKLNNVDSEINRGIELLLRNRRKRSKDPKIFQVNFGKVISFFRRAFHSFIDFYFDIKKK
jgi:hypothetical protein